MKVALLRVINQKKAKNLPDWVTPPTVNFEDFPDKVFDIRDTKGQAVSIKCNPHSGEATYFNGDDEHTYVLRFIRYEEFIDQFRTYSSSGAISSDWTKNWSRPDYLVYDITDQKRCVILHELSSGSIKNKKRDGVIQLLNAVRMLDGIPEIKSFLDGFNGRYCYLSAKGCVDFTPSGMADSFMDIYRLLPDPLPINNTSISSRGFLAFESKVVKL